MNFLAHCYLSCSDEEILIGNIVTDFIRKSEESHFVLKIKEGIALHRKIDSYTDKHKHSLWLRNQLRERHGKYSAVVVDLIWDFYLCKNWSKYSVQPLAQFALSMYDILNKYMDVYPLKLKSRMPYMIEDDFLLAYDGVQRASKSLEWMDRRVKFDSQFHEAILDIEENDLEIDRRFNEFFPDLIKFVETECEC